MNSTLKTALPIGLVVLMVFGITFMSQFTAPTQSTIEQTEIETAQPLIAGSAEMKFDLSPNSPPHFRTFPGFFEVGTDGSSNRVGFIIRNPRPASVFLTALVPSCATCTSARAAAIPADALRNYFQNVAIGPLWSPVPFGDLLSGIAWVQTRPKMVWHEFAFNDPSNKFELPGATTADGESWGILELGFKMAAPGAPGAKQAAFDVYDGRGNKLLPQPFPFTVLVGGREAQELNVYDYSLQELSDSNPVQALEVFCLSATRTNLPPPVITVGGKDPHITLAPPIPLDEETLRAISHAASIKTQSTGSPTMINFRCGYRIQAAINRDINGKSMDVGPYEKEIFVGAGPGIVLTKPARLHIHGNISGAIRIEAVNRIDFGSYDSNFVQKKDIRLWTERKGLELEVDPKLCDPDFLKFNLSQPSMEADRTYWTLNVQIPPKEGKRPPWEGFVYLRAKGEKPFNMRIQVSGHGR